MHDVSFRVAAYAVCRNVDRLLLALSVEPDGRQTWTLPGGRVEHGEDSIEAVVREVKEESGLHIEIERLLGIDSRFIPAAESWGGADHQSIACSTAHVRSVERFDPKRTGRRSMHRGLTSRLLPGFVEAPSLTLASPSTKPSLRPGMCRQCELADCSDTDEHQARIAHDPRMSLNALAPADCASTARPERSWRLGSGGLDDGAVSLLGGLG